jgi:hypothetical protein
VRAHLIVAVVVEAFDGDAQTPAHLREQACDCCSGAWTANVVVALP